MDPIKTHENHGKRLEEIFGKIRNLFRPKPSADPKTFLDAMRRYQATDSSDSNCQDLDTGKKLNKVASGTPGTSEVKIGINTIKNIKGLRFEIIGPNKRGTGKYNNAIVDDFRCYDTINDPYGIAWLFAMDAEYIAEYISGDLKYLGKNTSKKSQNVNFVGNWTKGMFHGNFMGGDWGGQARFSKQAKFITQPKPTRGRVTTSKSKRGTKSNTGKTAAQITTQSSPTTTAQSTTQAQPTAQPNAGTTKTPPKKGKINIKESKKA